MSHLHGEWSNLARLLEASQSLASSLSTSLGRPTTVDPATTTAAAAAARMHAAAATAAATAASAAASATAAAGGSASGQEGSAGQEGRSRGEATAASVPAPLQGDAAAASAARTRPTTTPPAASPAAADSGQQRSRAPATTGTSTGLTVPVSQAALVATVPVRPATSTAMVASTTATVGTARHSGSELALPVPHTLLQERVGQLEAVVERHRGLFHHVMGVLRLTQQTVMHFAQGDDAEEVAAFAKQFQQVRVLCVSNTAVAAAVCMAHAACVHMRRVSADVLHAVSSAGPQRSSAPLSGAGAERHTRLAEAPGCC